MPLKQFVDQVTFTPALCKLDVVVPPMFLAPDCHFLDPRLPDLYEKAKAAGASAFYFWGHSYELCSEKD
jgi:hypothetical protein